MPIKKKWAFVSDYCRIDVVYQYGGIYLDTDVEVKNHSIHYSPRKCFAVLKVATL